MSERFHRPFGSRPSSIGLQQDVRSCTPRPFGPWCLTIIFNSAQEMVCSAIFTRPFGQEQLLRPFGSMVLVNSVQALAHRSVTTKPFPCSPIMLNNAQVVADRLVQGNSCTKVLNISFGHIFSRPFEASVDRSMLGHPVQAYNRPLGQSFQDRSIFIPLEDRSVKALADRSVIFSRSFLNLSTVIVLHKMIEIIKLK
ncbi:hypothetical protein LR48_Vigan06g096300 [Vigna angularis]|uniref:Uncharacterized protein n=1 Tax=Phaseolus angularis TaxID=3914 RepID=A0A0L9USV3_PHAAN|nr:hypothetical protein LR48_Vigan06g096300 [Vigna angularis]